MKGLLYAITGVLLIVVFLFGSGALYVVDEREQIVVTQFGKPVGEAIKDAGLHVKMPFIQVANRFDKRLLEWDGYATQIPTKDKKYILVDTTARWKIVDPLKFFQTVTHETGAQKILDGILDSETRDSVTKYNLIEVVRNSNRIVSDLSENNMDVTEEAVEEIKVGRSKLVKEIFEKAAKAMPEYGIELVDVKIKRLNYVDAVRNKVYDRMISERKKAAEEYRSEGMGKSAEIEGLTSKELQRIQSEAYKTAQEIQGKADAEVTKIYAEAYNNDPDFYKFLKTLEAYKKSLGGKSTVLLTTDSDYFGYLKDMENAQ